MPDLLRDQQYRFAAHLRDPDHQPAPPGLEDRRLAIYRELFFNNLETLLAGNFPVIRQTLGTHAWHRLVRTFYARHHCQTPLFAEIGREFVHFLQAPDTDLDTPPWLADLAHYEWVELGLQIADGTLPAHDPGGNLLAAIPVLSPLAWAVAYAWPVHRIGSAHQPTTPPATPTMLLVRRDRKHEIRFAEISPLVHRLIGILRAGQFSGHQALQQLAQEAAVDDLPAFLEQGGIMLQRMHAEGTVLGTTT